MTIFPYTLVRFGGDSFEHWASLNCKNLNQELQIQLRLSHDIRESRSQLCEDLFNFVASLNDPAQQNIIQNIRRDIFNARKLKNNKLNKAREILDSKLIEAVEHYLRLDQQLKSRVVEASALYEREVSKLRTELQCLSDRDAIKKGLLLSSRSLLDRLPSYRKKAAKNFRKKELQVEQGLLKYLTRMYTKTSPFSTFTNLAVATTGDHKEAPINAHHIAGVSPVKGHIRLNNQLFRYLLDLLKNYKKAYLHFKLRPNPTLVREADNFLYLTNNNNIESFQRIPLNPVVDLILELVRENERGVSFKELVATLMDNIDAEQDELEAYVKQLIEYGCIEYNIGVSGIDPDWDVQFRAKLLPLEKIDVPYIGALRATLQVIRQLGTRYEQASVDERTPILQDAFEKFRSICMHIHEAAGLPEEERLTPEERQEVWKKKQQANTETDKSQSEEQSKQEETIFKHETSTIFHFKPEQIFYEDTTREAVVTLDKEGLVGIVEKLDELLQSMYAFKGVQDEKDTMNHYFKQKYGEGSETELLVFYEDYYRDYKRPQNEIKEKKKQESRQKLQMKQEGGHHSEEHSAQEYSEVIQTLQKDIRSLEDNLPFHEVASINARVKTLERWTKKLSNSLSTDGLTDSQTCQTTQQNVDQINNHLNLMPSYSEPGSFGGFVQFYLNDAGQLMSVLNSSFSGFGKMLSRFLHILDDSVTAELRDWNIRNNTNDSIFIEDCDASYFNANLHPPLMPHEVWMPGGHNTLPEHEQIPITDFAIVHSKEKDQLWLKHIPTGKNAYVFDLGFQGHMGRSQLFQLLEKFSKAEYLTPMPLINAINNQFGTSQGKKPPSITIQPRIVHENQIVLQRKSWFVPKALAPVRSPMDSDWDYYSKINEWRLEQLMPDEVFVFINPNRLGSDINPELVKKLTRDDYKPQYIDFKNPLLITLFEKLLSKVSGVFKIQEMLPNSEQMTRIDGERYVSEFVIQWYKGNEKSN